MLYRTCCALLINNVQRFSSVLCTHSLACVPGCAAHTWALLLREGQCLQYCRRNSNRVTALTASALLLACKAAMYWHERMHSEWLQPISMSAAYAAGPMHSIRLCSQIASDACTRWPALLQCAGTTGRTAACCSPRAPGRSCGRTALGAGQPASRCRRSCTGSPAAT